MLVAMLFEVCLVIQLALQDCEDQEEKFAGMEFDIARSYIIYFYKFFFLLEVFVK